MSVVIIAIVIGVTIAIDAIHAIEITVIDDLLIIMIGIDIAIGIEAEIIIGGIVGIEIDVIVVIAAIATVEDPAITMIGIEAEIGIGTTSIVIKIIGNLGISITNLIPRQKVRYNQQRQRNPKNRLGNQLKKCLKPILSSKPIKIPQHFSPSSVRMSPNLPAKMTQLCLFEF